MNTKNERTQSGESRPALPPTRLKRFRIEKLEERIAPKYNPQGKWVGRTYDSFRCS